MRDWRQKRQTQVPFGNDNQKSKNKSPWMPGVFVLGLLVLVSGTPGWALQVPAGQVTEQPRGTVLFSRQQEASSATSKETEAGEVKPEVTNTEREAWAVTSYDLDVHLTPATAGMVSRVRMTIRNDGALALGRVVLQVSSTLRWESFASGGRRLPFQTETLETDADHTGYASEAVVTLADAVAPGGTVELVGVYSGKVGRSSARLDRIGAPAAQARMADWDEVGTDVTALRGFGEALWYPVASESVFLGDGAKFFEAVGRARGRGRKTTVRLRLAIEYVGEAPHTAYFCGRMERLTAHSENQDVPIDESPGIATAEFGEREIGFATPSLFVTEKPETTGDGGLVTAVTEDETAFGRYVAAANAVQPMLAEWYGSQGPGEPLRMIDHVGQPFTDGPLIVTDFGAAESPVLAGEMAEGLSHAWMRSAEPWIEEGLGEFFRLVWMERTAGRDVAVGELQRRAVALALVEPGASDSKNGGGGQNLLEARDEVYVRTKAAAVWWMLRSIVGDDVLKAALASYRREAKGREDARGLERVLEQKAGVGLGWFFDDWVYADKGLPDLSIVTVTPRELPAKGGKGQGWLVAVVVKNDGDAVAEVPVTVRSGALTATERVRVAGRGTASTRILFEKTPEEVQVNDGETPEARVSVHTRRITVVGQ